MIRENKRGEKFYSCSGFPECKEAFNIDPEGKPVRSVVETEFTCEKCGKPMVMRQGRRGAFIGCTGYPKCRNALPVDDQRAALIKRMLEIVQRERPWIELYHEEDFTLSHVWLINSKPMGISYPAYKYRDGRIALVIRQSEYVRLDPAAHRVTQEGLEVALAPREFALLQLLMERPGTIYSRAQIEERLYGFGEEVESNAVEVHIHGLRRKLGAQFILTVRGVGYRVRPAA